MTDTGYDEGLMQKKIKSRKSSHKSEENPNSRRSSRASVTSLDQDSILKKLESISSVLDIDPQDLKKLEMMREIESDDDDDIDGDRLVEDDEDHVDHNNNNDIYDPEDEIQDADILKEMDEEKIIELKEAFELFDINSDGLITHSDLKKTFISLGQDVPDEEITRMLDDGSKPLDIEGFVKMIGKRGIKMDHDNVMCDALSKWDREESGLIPLSKIRCDLMGSGDRFTEEEVEIALEEAPIVVVKGKKMIDYREFSEILCGIRKKN